jgi:hypothetical protein
MKPSHAQCEIRASRLEGVRGQRGSALVEGALVAALLVSLLALGGAVHRRQARELAAAHDARLLSWSIALEGCQQRTEYARWLETLLGQGTGTPAERSVIQTPIHAAGRSGGAEPTDAAQVTDVARAPCNERPRNDDAGLAAFDTYLEKRLFPSNP